MTTSNEELSTRKPDHVRICVEEEVECAESGTLLDNVRFLHEALPELAADEVALKTSFLGREVHLPLMITGMTGGHPAADRINRDLAEAAQRHGLCMGVGSQRPMLSGASAATSYRVRDVAPDVFLAANIGGVQLESWGSGAVVEAAHRIQADAVCVHLNPAQELVQDKGDRDFRGCLEAITELVDHSPLPVIVKETGCGLSPRAARRLALAGVACLDVSGAGGTSWTRVEKHRGSSPQRALGAILADWGIPTAATIGFATGRGPAVIASGGVRDGRDLAAALALGADIGGMALPFLRAQQSGGPPALDQLVRTVSESLRAVCLLTESRGVADLRRAPVHLGPELRAWRVLDDRFANPDSARSRPHEGRLRSAMRSNAPVPR